MSVQIQGNSATVVEVESATRALRTMTRPPDPGALGSYKLAGKSGVMAAGLAAGAPIVSFRYSGANLALVRRITFSAGSASASAFAVGTFNFDLFIARTFTAADTGGTAATLTTPNGKLRTSFAATGLADFRVSSTAALTPGTRTLDAQQIESMVRGNNTGTSGVDIIMPMTDFFRHQPGEQPLVLAPNEGFVIQASVPGTGTWSFTAGVAWDELASW